jgi:steroid delta-isomerase-like uncharacterized protein
MARRMYDEMFGQGNVDLIDELLHDDFVEHEAMPGMPTGKDAPKAMTAMIRESFPDLRVEVDDTIEEGNKLAVRCRFIGTHRGEWMGVPATGRSIEVNVMDVLEFEGDKVIAHWGVMDSAGMMEQLGVGGPPA